MINKDDFFKKIKEAENFYYKNNPCYHCGPGNGCDDCRDCKQREVSNKMYKEVYNLKNEYKEKFGADYDKEIEALDKAHREKTRKENLLKEVWETCTFGEIIDSGFNCDKCSAEQLINAASEFESPEKNEDGFIEQLTKLCEETPKANLPWGHDVMNVLTDYFYNTELLDYFDNDELIDHCDGTWEMDAYLKKNQIESDNEVEEYTFKDFQKEVEELPNWKFRNFLCDIFMLGHCGSDEELINKLKERIR
jgi:hypothetical protein